MDALFAVLVPILPQLGGGGLLFAFAIWRERAHNVAATRWVQERAALIAEKVSAVAAERTARQEDEDRRDRRIAALAAENEALERQVDEERAARRRAEDGGTVRLPQHRARDEGAAS